MLTPVHQPLSCRLDAVTLARLHKVSASMGVSSAELVRRAVTCAALGGLQIPPSRVASGFDKRNPISKPNHG